MAVYFARAEATTFVKIGFSADPQSRLLLLQSGCPYRLSLTRVVEGDRRSESAFHELFAEHRMERDWFHWSPAMATATVIPKTAAEQVAVLRRYFKGGRGRQRALAQRLGINQSAVSQWERVPSDRLLAVEEFTGIPRATLRPDIFRPAELRSAA